MSPPEDVRDPQPIAPVETFEPPRDAAPPSLVSSYINNPRETLNTLKDLSNRTIDGAFKNVLPAFEGLLKTVESAANESAKLEGHNGNTWRKAENGWTEYDKSGKPVDNYKDRGGIADVSKDKDGNLTLSFKDGSSLKEQEDGSKLDYNQEGKLSKITYKDGSTRELTWKGDELVSMKSPDGKVWDRNSTVENGKTKYQDSWSPRDSKTDTQKPVWNGRLEVDPKTGDFSTTPASGDKAGQKTIMHTDKSAETIKGDGTRQIVYPNKNTVDYNANGTIKQMTIDGVKREFGWGKDGEGNPVLTWMKRTGEDGKTYNWQKTEKGWTRDGELTKSDFSVDNKNQKYLWTDGATQEKHTYSPNAKERIETPDGAQLQRDGFGSITKFEKDGKTRELTTDGKTGEPREIKDPVNNRTYKPSADGKTWTAYGPDGKELTDASGKTIKYDGKPELNGKGDIVFNTDGGKQTIKLDGSESAAIKNKDNSYVERQGDTVKITTADGAQREFTLKDGQPVKESITRNGKTETWTRGADKGNGVSEWQKEGSQPPVTRMGKAELDGQGNFKFTHYDADGKPDGRTYLAKTDGTEHLIDKANNSRTVYKNGYEHQMQFPDGSVRTFHREDAKDPSQITALEVQRPGDKSWRWDKVEGKDQYKNGDTTWNAKIETKDGKYIFQDLDNNTKTTRAADGKTVTEDLKTGITTEKVKGELVAVRAGNDQVSIKRNGANEITEIKDTNRNTIWSQQSDGTWKASALDESKPFSQPAENPKGKVELNEKGSYTFTNADRTREKFNLNGTQEKPGSMADLRDKISKSDILSKEQKDRLLKEYLPAIEKREFPGKDEKETQREKNETIYQLSRLLDSPGEGAFKPNERAKMLEQTAYQIANHTKLQQGQFNTCNVTDVGGALLHESPSHFARTIADVGTTGKTVTADGSTITPPRRDISEALRDQQFPLDKNDPGATGVSRMFAITAANIHWQRRTTDNHGNQVAKGSLYYHQEGGENVYHYQNGQGRALTDSNGRSLGSPNLYGADVMDVYRQITGKPETGRYITNTDRPTSVNGAKNTDSIVKVSSSEDLHKALQNGPFPKIIEVHTGNPPFYADSGRGTEGGAGGPNGGWHVVMITGYEPAFKDAAKTQLDESKSKVKIDNTWNPGKADRLTPDRAVSLSQLYRATKPY